MGNDLHVAGSIAECNLDSAQNSLLILLNMSLVASVVTSQHEFHIGRHLGTQFLH